jgi:peptidyl-prolyl cis-trans isomerase D
MFDFVAKHKRLLQAVLMLTAIPFVFFGLESYTAGGRAASDAATVDGAAVSMRDYQEETRRQQERLRQVLGPTADLSQFDTPEIRAAIVDTLVAQRLMTNAVARAGLTASKEEIVSAIIAAPDFQEGGKFSAERYANYLRVVGQSDESNVQRLRLEMPAARLAGAITGSAFQPRTVAARILALQGEKREVAEAFIPAEPYLTKVKVDEAKIKAYYDANPSEFKVAERVRAEYVVLSAEELGQGEAPTEAELKALYDSRAAQYGVAEQRRASHILLGTKEEAEKILAELRKTPQRFAELAKKHSQDTGSAEKGGDLGMGARGALASKALEDAVFALKPNELSDVVQSEFGFHIIRLNAVQAGKSRSLDEVRKELVAEVAKQKGAKKFADAAEAFNNLVYEQSDSLKPAADKYKLKIATSGWLTRQGSPEAGPLAHPKLLAALFSQDATRQKRNTDAVEVAPGVLVAARVAEHQPEKLRPLEEVRTGVARKLAQREAVAMARKDGDEKLAALAKGEGAGLQWSAAKTVSRQEPAGLGQAALRKVLTVDASKLPAYAGAERGEEGYALYRVLKVIPADAKAAGENAEFFVRLDRQAGAEQLETYVASLRAKAKIEVRKANLERK